MKEYQEFFDFLSDFSIKYREEECKMGYNVNLIDILGADENAHSRILEKLLNLKNFDNQRFEVLESFVRFVQKKAVAFGNIKVEYPKITRETERVDLWVKDANYAIIIENKIHHAGDMEEQLSRYIEKTQKHNYANEQIYIVYLKDYEPNEQSWGDYKEEFKNRYVRLSFKEDILSWLKDDVLQWVKEKILPDTRLKGRCLFSALEQYIDHLEGMYYLREIDNNKKMELKEFIKQKMGLDDNLQNNIAKLLVRRGEINNMSDCFNSLINDFDKEAFQKWKADIKAKYPDCYEEHNGNRVIVEISSGGTTVLVVVQLEENWVFNCVLEAWEGNLPEDAIEKVSHLFPRRKPDQIWKTFERYDYNGAFGTMLEAIKILES